MPPLTAKEAIAAVNRYFDSLPPGNVPWSAALPIMRRFLSACGEVDEKEALAPSLKKLMEALKETVPDCSLDRCRLLIDIGWLFLSIGHVHHADASYQHAMALARSFGNQNPIVLTSCSCAIAKHYLKFGHKTEARHYVLVAAELHDKSFDGNGEVHIVFDSLTRTALHLGMLSEAHGFLAKCLTLEESQNGLETEYHISSLRLLADIEEQLGDLEKAEKNYRFVLNRSKANSGLGDRFYLETLLKLAHINIFQTNHIEVEHLCNEVLQCSQEYVLERAEALRCLGVIRKELGDFDVAREHYELALQTLATAGPEADKLRLRIRESQARLYEILGDICTASLLFEEILSSYTQMQGEMGISMLLDFSIILGRLASCYAYLDRDSEALVCITRGMQIQDNLKSRRDLDFASMLRTKALVSVNLGELESATVSLREALVIIKREVGEHDYQYAFALVEMASFYQLFGELSDATEALEHAEGVFGELYSQGHPLRLVLDYVKCAQDCLVDSGEHKQKSVQNLIELTETIASFLESTETIGAERSLLSVGHFLRRSIGVLLGLHLYWERQCGLKSEVAGRLFSIGKSLVLRLGLAGAQRTEFSAGGEAMALHYALSKVRSEIAQAGFSKACRPISVNQLYSQKDDLERRLGAVLRRSLPDRSEMPFTGSTRSGFHFGLPEGTVLIDFYCTPYLEFDRNKCPRSTWHPAHYLALVYRGETHPSGCIDLGDARDIDALIAEFRREIAEEAERFRESAPVLVSMFDLRWCPDLSMGVRFYEICRNLHTLVFGPLHSQLLDVKKMIICPCGNIAHIPLGCLLDTDGVFVAEKHDVFYVSTIDDTQGGLETVNGRSVAIIGSPNFDALISSDLTSPHLQLNADYHGQRTQCAWKRLDGAEVELRIVARTLESGDFDVLTLLQGEHATVEFFLSIVNPQILHVATHAFFTTGSSVYEQKAHSTLGESTLEEPDTPINNMSAMVRSGLVLTGANSGAIQGDSKMGLVTAEEIAGMILSKTQFVVLSACESGVGECMPGEGVLGLRRAFRQAGAGGIVMSLWKIADVLTPEFMAYFYHEIIGGADYHNALIRTQRHLLVEGRRLGKRIHPFYWGAFISEGVVRSGRDSTVPENYAHVKAYRAI